MSVCPQWGGSGYALYQVPPGGVGMPGPRSLLWVGGVGMSRGLVMPGPRSLPRVGVYMSIGVGWVCISTLSPWTWDWKLHPPRRYTPRADANEADGTHPTGMFSCYYIKYSRCNTIPCQTEIGYFNYVVFSN